MFFTCIQIGQPKFKKVGNQYILWQFMRFNTREIIQGLLIGHIQVFSPGFVFNQKRAFPEQIYRATVIPTTQLNVLITIYCGYSCIKNTIFGAIVAKLRCRDNILPELPNSLEGIETDNLTFHGVFFYEGRNSQIPWKGLKHSILYGLFCLSVHAGTPKFPGRD